MKTLLTTCSLIVCAIACGFTAGCAGVSVPPAKGYTIRIGDNEFFAKSVKIHGPWVEIQTETGTVWANDVEITPIEPRN